MSGRKRQSQVEPAGNTDTAGSEASVPDARPAKKQAIQCYAWFFTLPMEAEPVEPEEPKSRVLAVDLWNILREHCKTFTFQLEQGEGGYKHYQGHFSLKVKERSLVLLKNMLGLHNIHLEPRKNVFAAERYCTKSETRVEGPWNQDKKPLKPKLTELRPWQQGLLDEMIASTDDRKVIWYVDKVGGQGKTTFGIHMNRLGQGFHYFKGKFPRKDLLYLLSKESNIKGVIIDIARSDLRDFDYGILEILKDGFVRTAKYEGALVEFDPPPVIVFSNGDPDKNELSDDRWDIRTFN